MSSESSASTSTEDLGRSATTAFGWSFLNTVAGRLGTMGIGILLARLLGPQEFGTYAVAYVALVAVLSFSELGVSLAIVRWPGDPKEIAGTVSTISLVASLFLAGAGFLAAPWFTVAMGNPEATPVVRLLALNIVVSGVVQTPAALMQRYFNQKGRLVTDQVNVWLGALVSIGCAVAGMGAMSLAVGRLAGAVVSGIIFLRLSPLPFRLQFNRSKAAALLTFGLPLAGASILVFLVGYLDQVVVGHLLGPTALGYYVLAFNLAGWPIALLSLPMRSVAPAAFSRLQHDPRAMTRALASSVELLTKVSAPVCVCIAVAALPLVTWVYGNEWAPSSQVLLWLALAAVARILHELFYDYLVVIGASGGVLWVQGTWLVVVVPLMIVGAKEFGLAGVAASQLVVAVVVVLPAYLLRLRRRGVAVGPLIRSAVPGIVGGLVTAGVVWVALHALSNPWVSLPVTAILGLAIIAVLVYPQRARWSQLRAGRPIESADPDTEG